jgi:hypothetical protein
MITTKYHGPTNTKGSRIQARCDLGNVTVPFDHALGVYGNHEAAARALAGKVGLTGRQFAVDNTPEGYVFVQVRADLVTF